VEAGRWKLEGGSWKMEAGRWKLEDGSGCTIDFHFFCFKRFFYSK
jgi:hypothetical protein